MRGSLRALVLYIGWAASPWAAGETWSHREYATVVGVEPIVETVPGPPGGACETGARSLGESLPPAATIGEDVRRQLRLWRRQRDCRRRRAARERILGYWVTYRFEGRIATTRLPYDPGDRIPVDVSLSPLP